MYKGFVEYIRQSVHLLQQDYSAHMNEDGATKPSIHYRGISNHALDSFMKILLYMLLKRIELCFCQLKQEQNAIEQFCQDTIADCYASALTIQPLPSPPIVQESFPHATQAPSLESQSPDPTSTPAMHMFPYPPPRNAHQNPGSVLNIRQRAISHPNTSSITNGQSYRLNPVAMRHPSTKCQSFLFDNLNSMRRTMFDPEKVAVLYSWIDSNINDPYPTIEEKYSLMAASGLTLQQLNNWFINTRRRYVKKPAGHRSSTCNQSSLHNNKRQYSYDADVDADTEHDDDSLMLRRQSAY